MDPYKELGVKKNASPDEIKKAYRKKARKVHPDHGGTAEEFHKVQTSYLVLANPESRAKYDDTGKIDEEAVIPIHDLILGVFNDLVEQLYNESEGIIDIALSIDIIKSLKDMMQGMQVAMRDEAAQLRKRAKLYKQMSERLHKKTGGINLFSEVLIDKYKRAQRKQENIEHKASELDRALVIISDYIFVAIPKDEIKFGSPEESDLEGISKFMEVMHKISRSRREKEKGE